MAVGNFRKEQLVGSTPRPPTRTHPVCAAVMHREVLDMGATEENLQAEEVSSVDEKNGHHRCVCLVCFRRQNEMPGRCVLVIRALQQRSINMIVSYDSMIVEVVQAVQQW